MARHEGDVADAWASNAVSRVLVAKAVESTVTGTPQPNHGHIITIPHETTYSHITNNNGGQLATTHEPDKPDSVYSLKRMSRNVKGGPMAKAALR